MTDNKTVKFDASQYQLVPKVPFVGMQDGAEALFLNMPVDPHDPESRTAFVKALWSFMLAAAPTPPAQSVGQEAGTCLKCGCKDGVAHAPYWNHKGDWTAEAIWVCDKCDGEHIIHLDAAPVNGGERKKSAPLFMTGWQLLEALDLVAPDRYTDRDQLDCEIALQMGDETCHSGPGLYAWEASEPEEGSSFLAGERAADAQQATAINTELLEALEACVEYGSMTGAAWVSEKAHAAIVKAQAPLASAERVADAQRDDNLAAVRAAGFHDVGALLSAYKRCADHVRQQSIETAQAALTSPAKVGGDEREAFEVWWGRMCVVFSLPNSSKAISTAALLLAKNAAAAAWNEARAGGQQ